MTVFELETCIEEYGAEVYSFCLHLTGVREWADELYQDTFLTATDRAVLVRETELTESIETELLRAEERRYVQRVVDGLAEKYRVIILLYYMEELPVAQIADLLHIPPVTVKSRLYQARKLLRKQLEVLLDE